MDLHTIYIWAYLLLYINNDNSLKLHYRIPKQVLKLTMNYNVTFLHSAFLFYTYFQGVSNKHDVMIRYLALLSVIAHKVSLARVLFSVVTCVGLRRRVGGSKPELHSFLLVKKVIRCHMGHNQDGPVILYILIVISESYAKDIYSELATPTNKYACSLIYTWIRFWTGVVCYVGYIQATFWSSHYQWKNPSCWYLMYLCYLIGNP